QPETVFHSVKRQSGARVGHTLGSVRAGGEATHVPRDSARRLRCAESVRPGRALPGWLRRCGDTRTPRLPDRALRAKRARGQVRGRPGYEEGGWTSGRLSSPMPGSYNGRTHLIAVPTQPG